MLRVMRVLEELDPFDKAAVVSMTNTAVQLEVTRFLRTELSTQPSAPPPEGFTVPQDE